MLSQLLRSRHTKTFLEASQANREDRFRKGDILVLPPQGDLIIAGDIHGNINNFNAIIEKADLENHPERHLIIHELIHNIYGDEYWTDHSWECLVEGAMLKTEFPDQVHVVLGNHELSEYQSRDIMKDGRKIPLVFKLESDKRKRKSMSKIQKAVGEFIKSQLVGVKIPGGLWMSHSIPNKTIHKFSLQAFASQDQAEMGRAHAGVEQFKEELIEDLVWGRDFSDRNVIAFCKKVQANVLIIGHEPCDNGFMTPHPRVLVIDSKDANGCYLHFPLGPKYGMDDLKKRLVRIWDED